MYGVPNTHTPRNRICMADTQRERERTRDQTSRYYRGSPTTTTTRILLHEATVSPKIQDGCQTKWPFATGMKCATHVFDRVCDSRQKPCNKILATKAKSFAARVAALRRVCVGGGDCQLGHGTSVGGGGILMGVGVAHICGGLHVSRAWHISGGMWEVWHICGVDGMPVRRVTHVSVAHGRRTLVLVC